MQTFHVSVHSCPLNVAPGESFQLSRRRIPTLAVAGLTDAPLDVTFEQVRDKLAVLPRMFIEPDGAFVWAGFTDRLGTRTEDNTGAWQLEGVLYDQGDRLSYVELNGLCSEQAFDRFLGALGWPRSRLMFQLLAQAVFLDEKTFRQLVFHGQPVEPE